MISSTLGAPLGGTTRGGHQGLESFALSLITPPNFEGGGGSCFPLIVVVALGEPNMPVTCAAAGAMASAAASKNATTPATTPISLRSRFMRILGFFSCASGCLIKVAKLPVRARQWAHRDTAM